MIVQAFGKLHRHLTGRIFTTSIQACLHILSASRKQSKTIELFTHNPLIMNTPLAQNIDYGKDDWQRQIQVHSNKNRMLNYVFLSLAVMAMWLSIETRNTLLIIFASCFCIMTIPWIPFVGINEYMARDYPGGVGCYILIYTLAFIAWLVLYLVIR